MSLLGAGALMMWCDYPRSRSAEQGAWHSKEHLPERLSVPGFLRGRRGIREDGDNAALFILYELTDLSVMTSSAYLARLNAPTPWTVRVNAATSNFNRSPGRVMKSWGLGAGGVILTARFAAPAGHEAQTIREAEAWSTGLAEEPAVTGAHFIATEPDWVVATREQEQRGRPDALAALVVIAEGYDPESLGDACRRCRPPSLDCDVAFDGYRIVHLA
ncbi:MAG: hypothetical protein WDN01_01945 [Rhizomicrobium sp.]